MGFIPLIFFSSAFIFLWAIVNYSSLKKTNNDIDLLIENLAQLIKEKGVMFKNEAQNLTENAPTALFNQVNQFNDSSLPERDKLSEFFTQFGSRSLILSENKILEKAAMDKQIKAEFSTEIVSRNSQIISILAELKDKVKNYNQLIKTPPSKFIARLFNFRPTTI